MYAHDRALLDRILAFDIDGRAATLNFEKRLARECAWSVAFARRVIAEYRRFLYLAMTAGHPVTPSDEVDQAWHLHMVYTESYWTRLVGTVLPRALHHNPTAGGTAEDAKFVDWYERTLNSYRAAFEQEPPIDIWPASKDRFDAHRQFQRVRKTENWIVPKRTVTNFLMGVGGISSLGFVLGVGSSHADSSGAGGLVCGAISLLVLACVFGAMKQNQSAFRKNRRNSDTSSGTSSCGTSAPFFFGGTSDSPSHHGAHNHSGHSHEGHGSGTSGDPNDAGAPDAGGSDGGSSGCSSGSSCSSGCGGGGGD